MQLKLLLSLAVTAPALAHNVGDLCTGMAGVIGVCIPTSECNGAWITGACPGTPDYVRCCTASSCANGAGRCKMLGDPAFRCSGRFESGWCPGPWNYQCCIG